MKKQKNSADTKGNGQRIKVGDRVRFHFGNQMVTGIVSEDRGSIGVGGRRLLRVHIAIDGEERALELPAEEIRAA